MITPWCMTRSMSNVSVDSYNVYLSWINWPSDYFLILSFHHHCWCREILCNVHSLAVFKLLCRIFYTSVHWVNVNQFVAHTCMSTEKNSKIWVEAIHRSSRLSSKNYTVRMFSALILIYFLIKFRNSYIIKLWTNSVQESTYSNIKGLKNFFWSNKEG